MSDESKPPVISFDDFLKIDLRVGTVLSIEAVPKSKKLLKLEVDFGPLGKRTILSGLAPVLPVEIPGDPMVEGPGCHLVVGQQVVAVLNLAPRSMMGFESHGMVLAVRDSVGKLWTVSTATAVANGSELN
jgi:methionyl-tRNA synthetase